MIIPKEFIGAVIGKGGEIIQTMQKETNTIINIEEQGEFGIIDIAAPDKSAIEEAMTRIKAIITVPEVGETYTGKIISIMTFGAFVEILPGKEALLHISEIDWNRIETMEDSGFAEGDEITVKLTGLDAKTGKLKLSMRALKPKPEGYVEPERPKRDRSDRFNNGGDRRDFRRDGRRDDRRRDDRRR
jgi:polyribonucleotide nucleotidyltransferase